jgi:Fe-S cluster assembly protein SufD
MTAVMDSALLPEALALPRPGKWEGLRLEAEAALAVQSFPTLRQESWKYTDLAPMKALAFPPGALAEVDVAPMILPEARGSRLVFVNGHFDSRHSNVTTLPAGVRFLNLACASELAHDLGTLARPGACDLFANLNSARFQDGALVVVPKGVKVEAPLHVIFVSDQDGAVATSSRPRLLVVVEPGAALTLVEEYRGRGTYLTNAVAEVIVREDGILSHERIQRESPEAFHFSHLAARVERRGTYTCRTIAFGARLSRCTPHVVLAQEGAHVTLDGLALLGDTQVADTHSFIDHTVPHCNSRQTHKTIADHASRVVFNGMIYVRPGAQGTDAQQQCRGLLLSGQARIDTKPQLEIYADDVKCAHGAAIGQLDPEELFYLQSRGLRPELARNLLTYAFASDLLARIPVASLKRQLRQFVLARTNAENLETLT